MKTKLIVFLVFIVTLQSQTPNHLQKIDGIAAIVGDKVVLLSDINQALAMTVFQQQLDPTKNAKKIKLIKEGIVKSTIDRKIVLSMAELDSIEINDKEVDRALDQQVNNIILQAGGEKAAEKALGQPIRTFKREYWYDVRDMLIAQKYQQKLISSVSINKNEVVDFYETHKDSIPMFPTTIKIKHLLIKTIPSKEQIDKTVDFLSSVRLDILNRKVSFENMATKHSQDPGSKKTGGSLGFLKRGTLVTEFETVAFNLKPGEISEPIKTDFGYHIIETQEIRGDRIKARHILITPPLTEKDESYAFKKTKTIKDSSSSIGLFLKMVKNHSMDLETNNNDGNLGWINPKTYPIPEFSLVLNQIEEGVCFGPVKSTQGYHLLWLENKKQGGLASLDKNWSDIELMALNKKRIDWFSDWIKESKQHFYIKMNN